ncbi:MAG: deaminase [Thermoguttaceae bacterium]
MEEDWLDANGSVFHTIHTYYDADGETVGVTETDTTTLLHTANPASCTNYEYTYDADGNMLTSRMAPGDLAQTPGAAYTASGSLGSGSSTVDWNGGSTAEPYQTLFGLNLTAGQTVLVQVSSTAFATALLVQPPGSTQSNWLIATATDGNNAWLLFTVGQNQGGNWSFAGTSPSPKASGQFTMNITVDPNPFVPTALTGLAYTYYLDGSVHTVTDSSNVISNNTATTTYVDDALGRVQSISQAGSSASTKEVEFAYYNNSQVQTVATYPNDSLNTIASYDYDGDGRLTSLSYTGPGSTITTLSGSAISYGLEYDPAGNITQATSADGTDNYGLNGDNELTSASLTSESYTYDQNGNRVSSSGGYSTGAANRMLCDGTYDYQYDADGNRTERTKISDGSVTLYSYDYGNRLTDVVFKNGSGVKTEEIQYTYDYAGQLIRTAIDATGSGNFSYTYTVYDGENPYLQVSDPKGLAVSPSSATISQRYLYGQAVDQILATDNGAGTVLWGLADFEGTIRDVVNSSGKEVANGHIQFNSFGAPINGTAPLANFLFGLAGMRYDPVTGNYLTESVFYDPSTGRRLSQDPLGFASGTTNFTAWAGNSPVENVDPSGQDDDGDDSGDGFYDDSGDGSGDGFYDGSGDDESEGYSDAQEAELAQNEAELFAQIQAQQAAAFAQVQAQQAAAFAQQEAQLSAESALLNEGAQLSYVSGSPSNDVLTANYGTGAPAPPPLTAVPPLTSIIPSGPISKLLDPVSLGINNPSGNPGEVFQTCLSLGPGDFATGSADSTEAPAPSAATPMIVATVPLGRTGASYGVDAAGGKWYNGMEIASITQIGTGKGPFDDMDVPEGDDPSRAGAGLLGKAVLTSLFPAVDPSYELTFKNVPVGCNSDPLLVMGGGPPAGRAADQALTLLTLGEGLRGSVPESGAAPNILPEVEPVPAQPVAPSGFDALAAQRVELGLPAAGTAEDTATLARLEINGQTFNGINRGLQDPVTQMSLERVNAQTLTHAEADVVQQAVDAGMQGTAKQAEMWVDRDPCGACGQSGGLRSLARNLGVDELIVHSPSGTQTITPTR